VNGAGLRRSRATTATRRGSRSPRSPGGFDGRRRQSRHTFTTGLRLAKGLRIAPRTNASLGATRAAFGAFPDHEVAPGLSTAELTPPWPGGTALRPIPAGARPYAGALHARVRVAAPRGPRRYGTPRPTVPSAGWCLQRPRTLGRPPR
jgi:hypothetical protein